MTMTTGDDYNRIWTVHQFRRERARLQAQIDQVSNARARLTTRYAALERLHGTLNRDAVIEAIDDILTNVVGAEQVGVFDLDPSDASLNPVSSIGVACIPLKIESRLIGAIVIFTMQPLKVEFTQSDLDLFEVLSKHAALALYTSALHSKNEGMRSKS